MGGSSVGDAEPTAAREQAAYHWPDFALEVGNVRTIVPCGTPTNRFPAATKLYGLRFGRGHETLPIAKATRQATGSPVHVASATPSRLRSDRHSGLSFPSGQLLA